jgi:hypothetical protein
MQKDNKRPVERSNGDSSWQTQSKKHRNDHSYAANHEIGKAHGNSAIDKFYASLVKIRSVISTLDSKLYLDRLPALLPPVCQTGSMLNREPVELSQCLEAVSSLKTFHAREKVTKHSIPRYCRYQFVQYFLLR